MNFETIYNTRGQKVPMFGTLKELKGGGMTANNKPFAKVSITDDTGKTSNVKIYGDVLPQAQQIGQRLQWTISTYDYTYQGKQGVAFSGFWNSNAQVAPLHQQYASQPQNQYGCVPQMSPQTAGQFNTAPAPKTFDQAVKQTYHPEPDRQDDIKFGQAANLAMQQCLIDKSILMFEDYQQKYYKFLINRKMPTKTPAPQPDYDDEPVQETTNDFDSSIPF